MNIGILEMYMYLPMFVIVIGMAFVFFSGDVYRYECQDPLNWKSPECNPPICKAAGVCTEDLLIFEPGTIEEKVTEEVIIDENTIIGNSSEITDYFNQIHNGKEENNVLQ